MKDKAFLEAFWESPTSALVFLMQDWDLDLRRIPMESSTRSIQFEVERASHYDVGKLSGYYFINDMIRFVLDPQNYPSVEFKEKIYVSGEFNDWQNAIGNDDYCLNHSSVDGHDVLTLDLPKSILGEETSARFRFVTEKHRWLILPENTPNLVPNKFQGADFLLSLKQTGNHVFRLNASKEVNLFNHVRLLWNEPPFEDDVVISNAEFYLSLNSDLPMGVTRENGCSTFRIFAPRASRVTLELFTNLKKQNKVRTALNKNNDGSWEITLDAEYEKYFYYYYIDGINYDGSTYFDSTIPVVDPYALAMASSKGPGIVFYPDSITPLNDHFHPPHWHDLVICEVHMRDLLKNSRLPVSNTERTQYTGMSKWLRQKENYLKSLGVNAIEFQPLHEFEYESKDEYHWGYMPVNYFSPASANERFPKSGSQMKNLQDMVRATHEAGFACILDVVYNHLGSPNALHSMDKHYFFGTNSNFELTNWSGVGNDLRCNSPMTKRLIIDSLKYYAIHYGFDGFRFDLAELIGLPVLAEIEMELKKIKPSIILISEPWSFRGHIAEKLKVTGFSSWNDRYRDFFVEYLKGNGSPNEFEYYLKGSPDGLTRFPAQTVNYSESHDDYCWLDLITENANRDGSHPTMNDIRRTHLMFSMLFMSLGIPMIAEGQDFLRSKSGIRNTYQKGDVNALNYNNLTMYSNTHDYARKWIEFRMSSTGILLRHEKTPSDDFFKFIYANDHGRGLAVIYNADRSRGSKQLVYAINPTTDYQWYNMNDFDMNNCKQIADQMRFDKHGLNSALVQLRDRSIVLPPLSCGLWIKK